MNILLIILSIVGGIIVLLLLIALFTRKRYTVMRDITINKSHQEVFNYIKHLKNQDHYSKWVMVDPNMKKTFSGTDGNVGFVYAWDGNKQAGKGEQEIKSMVDGKRLDVEIRFERPFAGIAKVPLTTEPLNGNGQTKVTWGMSSEMKYPMNIMLLFMSMDNLLGKDLEASLTNLKGILEK